MENLCGICFAHAELYQISGYHMPPMCLKCSETFNAKSLNIYQNLAQNHPAAGVDHQSRILSAANGVLQQNVVQHLQQQHQQHQLQQQQHHQLIQIPQTHSSSTSSQSVVVVAQQQHQQTQQQQQQQSSSIQSHQQQQQQQQDPHQGQTSQTNPANLCTTSNAAGSNNNNQNVSRGPTAEQINAIKVEQIDLANKLEQSMLQHGDNEILFGEAAACGMCDKTFTRKSLLLAHMRNHSVDRKFICSFCQKGFTQAANLRNHERIHRNERPFVCGECGKAFTQVTNLNNHRRLHTGERPFVCVEITCGRAFAQVTNLNNHMKTHHKIQQYVCNQCPKKFTQVISLNQHLLVHSGIRGFSCPQCPDKTFKQQSHLSQHMKTHGVFPYQCGQCDQKFVQVSHLTQHMKTHADFRYKCNVCMSAFNQESLLRKHMQRHIDDGFIARLYACPMATCKETFTDRDELTKHVENEHTKTEPSMQRPEQRSHVTKTESGAHAFHCYFEGCNQTFEATDKLNEHLIIQHNMLYKDIEARSKMNLLFLEQFKHQMAEQYAAAAAGGHSDLLQHAGVGGSFPTPSQISANIGGAHHHSAARSSLKTENNVDSKPAYNADASPATTAASLANHHFPVGAGSYCVCSVCFNVFKNMKTLSRHMLRFHGMAQH